MARPYQSPKTATGLASLIQRTLAKVESLTYDTNCCLDAELIDPWDGLKMLGPVAALDATADQAVVLGLYLDGQRYRLIVERTDR